MDYDSQDSPKKKKSKKRERAVFSDVSIPADIRNQLQFNSESGEFASAISGQDRSTNAKQPKQRSRKQNKTIDGLIGQANLSYAKSRIDEALSFLREAIRQDPRNPDAYNQIANIYVDQNQPGRGFEYRLLGAHLDSSTVAAEWAEIGETAVKLERIEEATACYGNAVRCEPENWFYYEKRIELLEALDLTRFAMKVRLQAAQAISCKTSRVNFDWLQTLIKTAAEYYINVNDEEKAMEALKIFVLRCHEFKRSADVQHLVLLKMWMGKERYEECVKSILALCPSIKAVNEDGSPSMKITVTHMNYQFKPFLPPTMSHFEVEEVVNTLILGRLVVCLLHLGRLDPINSLIDILLKRSIDDAEEEEVILEIARTYHKMAYYNHGIAFIEKILDMDIFERNPDALFLFALFEQIRGNQSKALDLYRLILEIQPNYVNARINMSTILQNSGHADAALQSLMDHDLDLCAQLPDERLLIRQADVLYEQSRLDLYVRCVRMIMVPYFYAIYKFEDFSRRNRSRSTQCNVLYRTMLAYLLDTPIEKQIKRQGAVAYAGERPKGTLSAANLHDYCLRVIEILYDQQRYNEMLQLICLASLEPKISNTGNLTFLNMTLYGCIKAQHYPLAFEYLRYLHTKNLTKISDLEKDIIEPFSERLYNAMNYVFCHHQAVPYHRYIERSENKNPDVIQLQMISGNNSLVAGTYRHALHEYLKVWDQDRSDPLTSLLVALTFTHLACKKDINSRHLLAMRGIAFMQIYEELRGLSQEALYNNGRLLHQLSMYSGAVYFYNRVIKETTPIKIAETDDTTGEVIIKTAERYDLKRFAAHNLALIYTDNGNRELARMILETYCKI